MTDYYTSDIPSRFRITGPSKLLFFAGFMSAMLLFGFNSPGFATVSGYDVVPGSIIIKIQSDAELRSGESTSMYRQLPGTIPAAGSIATQHSVLDAVEQELRVFGGGRLEQAMPLSSHRELQQDMRMRHAARQLPGTRDPEAETRIPDDLTRTFFAAIDPSIDPVMVARKIARIPGVAYAEPQVVHEITASPNDPQFGQIGQNYFNYLRIPQAWEVTTSSPEIVIAIVDSGVDYLHPDLAPNLWRNPEPGRARELFPNIFAAVENDTIGWNFWESGPIFDPVQNADPKGTFQSHGTHVAGIAAAATNNGIGIASTGYNSRYMAVRAGGTAEDPRVIGFGFQGILYAAVNGAHVINASFGSTFNSQFGRDVVDFATSIGSVVVAAAGNTRQFDLFYPASYENALAVASIELNTGVRSNFTTYNYGIDVSVTGRNIMGTVFNNGYAQNTGTSMAAPIAAGVAALIRHAYPDWSPERVLGQIRSTANPSIYSVNGDVPYQLGVGLLDAGKALTTPMPSVRKISAEFLSQNGGRLLLDDDGFIRINVTNVGANVNALTYRIETVSGGGVPGTSGGSLGIIALGDTISFQIPIRLPSNMDPRENPAFLVHLSDPGTGYSDHIYVEYRNLFVDTHDANFVRMSFSSNGGIGYGVGGDERTGVGFVPIVEQQGTLVQLPNVLYESGLMVMYTVDNEVFFVDNVREEESAPLNFRPIQPFSITDDETGTGQVGRAIFDASFNATAPDLNISMHTFAMADPGPDQGVLVYFTLRNEDPQMRTYTDIYVGTYTDWDIGNFSRNSIRFSEADSMLIAYNIDNELPLVTTAHLGNIASALAIDNAWDGPIDSLNFGVYYGSGSDLGFTQQYKRWSMVAGTEMTSRDTTDISMVTSSGPFTLAPFEEITVGFAYLYGVDEDDLRDQVARARSLSPMPTYTEPRLPEYIPERLALVGNYPNPFNPSTRILVDVDRNTDVTLEVYDMLGRRVATLFEGELNRRRHEFVFDGSRLSSGIYLVVMQAAGERQTLKMTMIK